jgi:hypothetical protein
MLGVEAYRPVEIGHVDNESVSEKLLTAHRMPTGSSDKGAAACSRLTDKVAQLLYRVRPRDSRYIRGVEFRMYIVQ